MTADKDDPSGSLKMLTAAEVRKSYESLLASLQALTPRLGDRRTATAVQELSLRLGYFALALHHLMDGDLGKAEQALARADARAARIPPFFSRPEAMGEEDWTQHYH
jgi:hypothetical protein